MDYYILFLYLPFVCTVNGNVTKTDDTLKDNIPGDNYLPIVQAENGIIQGQTIVSLDGRNSHEYLGIPYATPPLGHLRFKPPEPFIHKWSGVLDARMLGPSCMQPRLMRSGKRSIDIWNPINNFKEDCLTLNLWTPYPRRLNTSVMVWIHGDSFIKGSSSLKIHNGKTLASHGDVIVVTFNYRLGAFGYLATGDRRIEGNMGLHDQRMALRWIQNNIGAFGGNRNSITIFGESSGAASVGLHLLSSGEEALFQRAILQSGSPLAYWATMTKIQASQRIKEFLKKVNCPDDNTILSCLNKIPAEVIVKAQQELTSVQFGHFTWVPIVDHKLILNNPRNMVKDLQMKRSNILLGSSKNEGSRWMVYLLHFLKYKEPFTLNSKELHSLIDKVFYDLSEPSRAKIKSFYLDLQHKKTNPKYNRDLYQVILEDRHMFCPMLDFAKAFSASGNDVFMYRFKHRSKLEDWPNWMGVVHGSDLQYVFGAPVEEADVFTPAERNLSLKMISYWSNFAKYGNPTSGQRGILAKWPKFKNGTSEKFVKFKKSKRLQVGRHFRDDHCQLWRKIETEVLQHTSEKKSSITSFLAVNETAEFGDSFFYNVF